MRSPAASASKSLAVAINLLATPAFSEHDFKRTLRRSAKALFTKFLSGFVGFSGSSDSGISKPFLIAVNKPDAISPLRASFSSNLDLESSSKFLGLLEANSNKASSLITRFLGIFFAWAKFSLNSAKEATKPKTFLNWTSF